ncbi:MAG: hypothetical protein AB1656_00875 [Candidatus Omnitrophota bacterium]
MATPILLLVWFSVCFAIFLAKHQPFYLGVFPAFFRALGRFHWGVPDSFYWDSFCEILALALEGAAGVFFLRLFVRLPRQVEIPAGVFIGIGLTTFVWECFAIFFLLNRYTVSISLLALILLFFALKKYFPQPANVEFSAEPLEEREHRIIYWSAFSILVFISALNFYHSLLFPVTYWDALIYYVHYGKMTYEQGGFPVLVCLQVGLGLGANYPHLYALHQAATAAMFGHWSDIYGQMLMPLANVGSLLVLYYLSIYLFKNRLIAILSLLAYRVIPYVTSYYIWASDYALVMCYTCLFLFFLAWRLQEWTLLSLQPLLCVAAIFPHINYLGWIVWPIVFFAAIWPYFLKDEIKPPAWSKTIGVLFLWFLLGITWNIRNWIVTCNPVYAFFPQIFGGINIDPAVLASCNQEWTYHGWGADKLGASFWQKIVNSGPYFVMDWRFAPTLAGLLIPSFFIGWKRKQRFFLLSGLLLWLYIFYQYAVSGLYWYHSIAVLPILALFAGRYFAAISSRRMLSLYGVLLLLAGLVPGVTFSLMGSKIANPALPLFAYPGISPKFFYRFAYPDAAPVWEYINDHLENGAVILTHDNRYHVYRDDLKIIHLDDCGLIPLYGRPYPENHKELLARGICYYFRIGDDEDSHPILRQLGHRAYLGDPHYYKLLIESGDAQLYELVSQRTNESYTRPPTPNRRGR